MKRRDFIQNISFASASAAFGGISLNACNNHNPTKITILHTNDVHSHIDPFSPNNELYPNMGGIARRASLIEHIRKENPNTLLFDAGDIFQGTAYFNYYGGELEFKLMSKLKYDAATIGNHDFDNGVDGLFSQIPHANFDFLCSNYDFSNTIMDTHTKPYKIFVKEGVKIGVFGLGIELDGLVLKKLYKETKYLDPIEMAQEMARILKEDKGCDLIICLSHLGYKDKNKPNNINDLKVAAATKNIDLIIGGHTHTFLDKPVTVKNIAGKNMLINQVGCFGLYLGKVDFYFDSVGNKFSEGASMMV